jgi:large subunit ribosomal protein L6
MPIALQGVEVKMATCDHRQGPAGHLTQPVNPLVKVNNDGTLFAPANESREANAMSGTMRALSPTWSRRDQGFRAQADLVGVGYRAQAQGDKLNLQLGFSHPVVTRCRKASRRNADADRNRDQGDRQATSRSGG